MTRVADVLTCLTIFGPNMEMEYDLILKVSQKREREGEWCGDSSYS